MNVNGIRKTEANLSQLKAGMELKTVKGDAKAESIFNAIDTDGNGVLDEKEIKDFKEAFDKNSDNIATKKEAKNFIEENNLKDQNITKKDIIQFLQEYGEKTENISDFKTNESGQIEITYTDNSQKIINEDNSYATIKPTEDEGTVTQSFDKNDVLKSELIETPEYAQETIYQEDGETPEKISYQDSSSASVTYFDEQGQKVKQETSSETEQSVILFEDDKPVTKEVARGTTFEKFECLEDGSERIMSSIENKGLAGKEIVKIYDSEGGYTQTQDVGNGKITTIVDKDSNVKSNVKTETINGQELGLALDNEGNIPGVIVQNGESPAVIAKKFGCSVDDLMKINADQLKGKGNAQYFEVGSEIKLPNSVSLEKFAKASEGRKSADEAKAEYARDAAIRKQKAEAAKQEQEYYKKLGVKNFNNKGQKIKVAGWGNKEFEVIGDVGYARKLVKRDGKLYTVSHDGKILREDYLQAHKAFVSAPKTQRNNTVSGQQDVTYVKDNQGKVWYFNEKTGTALVKGDYQKVVKQESAFVANQLHSAAKGMGTDEELLEKGVKNIYSRDILQGVNAELRAKDSDYAGDAQTMPVEALILDEMSHGAARPLFKTLINSGTMTKEEQAHTIKREIEHEVHGGLIGYTSTSDLNEVMQFCSNRDVRLEVEAQFKKDHPELEENEGSVVRSYIAGDGWNAQEVDQFDANWIKTGAYQEARYVYQTDENGNMVLDKTGRPVVVLDEGDQAHRNDVVGRLVFDYQDKEALNKGLDVINENPNSFDYQYLDQRAGEEIATDPEGKYQSRFTNQDNVQRYLAGFHSDANGNVDAGNVSASNTCLFKGIKPARVQAEESLYNAKNGDYSQTFDSMDSETYSAMSELINNGDIEGIKDMNDLYNKALNGTTNKDDKNKIKANAIISGQVDFSDKEIADFCIELMHNIDSNRGIASSNNLNNKSVSNGMGKTTNLADTQTEQLKAILQANPQVIQSVKQQVLNGKFESVTTVTAGTMTDTIATDTKKQYLSLIADTKAIAQEEVFLDANGNKITDAAQINAIKTANMQSLEQMRQYVAELERDYKKGVDAEGALSDMGNALVESSGFGTDREDVANTYRNAKLMLKQFEAAAQGKLRDSNGKVISAQDLAKQMVDKQDALAKTNSDYKQSVTYAKIGIVMAPVIVATAGAGAIVSAAGAGATAAGYSAVGAVLTSNVTTSVVVGLAAGGTTYAMNQLEYNTSYTGNTAENREQNLKDSIVNGITTGVGMGQMSAIAKLGNNLGTISRTGLRLGATVGSDVGVGSLAEYATNGDISSQGVLLNLGMSGVGNIIGVKSLSEKHVAPTAHPSEGIHVKQEAPITSRNEVADAEIARNIDQSHLNGRDREMIARELEAQGTPTKAELEAYAKEHGYQAPTAEEKIALDAHQEKVKAEYSEAHKIENNATITEQKAPAASLGADEALVQNLENEINGIDGQINQLNKQLAGAKRANQMGRKNGDTIKKLESQIDSLQQKRNAKATELETAKKPVETETAQPKTTETKAAESVKPEAEGNVRAAEEPRIASQEVKDMPNVEAKSKAIIVDMNSINTSEITPKNQSLWNNCKERLEKLTQELSMSNIINPQEVLARGRELLKNLKSIADDIANVAIKAKIQKIAANLKSLLQSKVTPQNAFKPVKTAEEAKALYQKMIGDKFLSHQNPNAKNLIKDGNYFVDAGFYTYEIFDGMGNPSADLTKIRKTQGTQWKMHVYADNAQEWANSAQIVMPYLKEHKINYKTLPDIGDGCFQHMRTDMNGSQKGKAFTIYFKSEEEFVNTAKALEARFKQSGLKSSGKVKNEAQVGDSGFLSYRHEGAERGTMYKPDNIEDPYLKNLASQPAPAPTPAPAKVPAQASGPTPAKPGSMSATHQLTSKERMEMSQIAVSINQARTPKAISTVQKWLDTMPECSQKSRLQAQLDQKTKSISPNKMDVIEEYPQMSASDLTLTKGVYQKVSVADSIRLADQVDIDFADFGIKFNSMKDGDSFFIGRDVTGINDVRINNDFISGQHLKIEKIDGAIYVVDLSSNGTTLNSIKPGYAAKYSPQLQQKFANAGTAEFTDMINANYGNLRRAEYSLDESVRGNITNSDLANNSRVEIASASGWFFRTPKGRTPVSADNVVDRISLNVVADKNLIAELDRLCATGTYVNAQGQTVRVDMPSCDYKTPQTLQGFTTRHDPITMYFDSQVSEEVQNAIADIAGKYARQSSNGKSLMNALEGRPYIAHESYTSPQEAKALWREAQELDPSLADAIHQELNELGDWNCSTGQFAACRKLVDEFKLAYPQYRIAG